MVLVRVVCDTWKGTIKAKGFGATHATNTGLSLSDNFQFQDSHPQHLETDHRKLCPLSWKPGSVQTAVFSKEEGRKTASLVQIRKMDSSNCNTWLTPQLKYVLNIITWKCVHYFIITNIIKINYYTFITIYFLLAFFKGSALGST